MKEIATLEEARAKRYNRWGGNPNGDAYREGKCAGQIYINGHSAQCYYKNGHGPGGLYCRRHDPVARKKREDERAAKTQAEWDAKWALMKWNNAAKVLCEGVTTEQLRDLGPGWLKRHLEGR